MQAKWALYKLLLLVHAALIPSSLSETTFNVITSEAAADNLFVPNPFLSGCLFEKVPNWTLPRVCNSDDDPSLLAQGLCRAPDFGQDAYMEIRINIGNWDSPVILSWLVQIILSEILGVPVSTETGKPHRVERRGFYDPLLRSRHNESGLDYSYTTSTHADTLEFAADMYQERGTADCRKREGNDDDDDNSQSSSSSLAELDANYQPCAHYISEYWDGDAPAAQQLVYDHKIEPPQTTGYLGHEGLFLTKFTADAYPELVSYRGLMGEENRQKLADLFLRPTTWHDYCLEVSNDTCATPDDVAQRAPLISEFDRMFAPGDYTGYFRKTDDNNCTQNPTTCTGHYGEYPCQWTSAAESSLYHLNIALKSNGKEGVDENGNGKAGYTSSQLEEMWHAANATKSNLILFWWTPEPMYFRYLGTDAEMQRIQLRPVTQTCVEARVSVADECSPNATVRAGPPEAACDNSPRELHKLISGVLQEVTHSEDIPAAIQSPAYDMLRVFQLTEAQLGDISKIWQNPNLLPHEAVCQWAVDNLDFLFSSVPSSYPRIPRVDNAMSAFGYAVAVLGILATLMVIGISGWLHKSRTKLAVRYAQVEFLWLLLFGSFLIGIGAILTALPATDGNCIATIWFINLGYTLELVPTIVKVGAINEMLNAASRMRRVTLTHKALFGAVAVISVLCVFYLVLWTVLDTPHRQAAYELTGETVTTATGTEEHIVGVNYYCSRGDSDSWQYAAVGWNAILLFSASVLAFQTRNIQQSFNESRTLAFMIYSHFVFVILRMCTFFLGGDIKGTTLDQTRSLLYSLDTICAIGIYILPKLMMDENAIRPSLGSTLRVSGINLSPGDLSGQSFHSNPFRDESSFGMPVGGGVDRQDDVEMPQTLAKHNVVLKEEASTEGEKVSMDKSDADQESAMDSSDDEEIVARMEGFGESVASFEEGQESTKKSGRDEDNAGISGKDQESAEKSDATENSDRESFNEECESQKKPSGVMEAFKDGLRRELR